MGVGVKTIGYLTITAGIFFAIKDKNLALQIVLSGVFLVIAGWVLVIKALKQANSED